MNKKHFTLLLLMAAVIAIAIPVLHVYITYLKEGDANPKTPAGYLNDASGLSLTPVDSIIEAASSPGALKEQLRQLLALAREKNIPVSIAGARHTMGGHTLYPHGIVINMRTYKHMHYDSSSHLLTVGSGALWQDVLNYLDQLGKSVAVMQAFSSFSVGGSISVNGHGWQKNKPPVSSSVVSFSIMLADGSVLTCSRKENPELFRLVIGGYGLLGIILDVQLQVVDNENLLFRTYSMKSSDYLRFFKEHAAQDPRVELVFGRLNVSQKDFLEKATLNVFVKTESREARKMEPASTAGIKRMVFRSSVNSEYGKRLRWNLETNISKLSPNKLFTRNEVLNDDVSLIENKDTSSTDILHEYFIPERNFLAFLEGLKTLLPNQKIDLLNITLRDVSQDNDSYLNYARENVFGFVLLFNQKKNETCEKEMEKLTMSLVQLAREQEGTYYLPYRLHVDRLTFRQIYPQADSFFVLKKKYDPEERFKNKFYDHYR